MTSQVDFTTPEINTMNLSANGITSRSSMNLNISTLPTTLPTTLQTVDTSGTWTPN
ncbi:MAG: hypothetical protein RR651_05400 [Lysinibacillus sp.]